MNYNPVNNPILHFTGKDIDDKFWMVGHLDLEDVKKWIVCFTATYAAGLGRKKEQLTWKIAGIGPGKWDRFRRELKRRAGIEKIVHLCIHKVVKPQTDEDIAFIAEHNARVKKEFAKEKRAERAKARRAKVKLTKVKKAS